MQSGYACVGKKMSGIDMVIIALEITGITEMNEHEVPRRTGDPAPETRNQKRESL